MRRHAERWAARVTPGDRMAGRVADRLLTAAGSLTVAVGVLHLGVSVAQYDTPSLDALWFAGSGLAVVLIGVLSLLAGSAPEHTATRRAAIGANVAGLALAAGFGTLTSWQEPQGPVLVALFLVGAAGATRGRAHGPND
jgi:hypothetical protein